MAQKKQATAQQEAPQEAPQVKTQVDRDNELVRGMFRFYEVPGAPFSFCFKKNPGAKIERYDMQDGEVYEIPRCVAEHLNKNCWYPVHEYTMQEDGKQSMRVGRRVQRVGFHSLDFGADHSDWGTPTNNLYYAEEV